ncbi:MAG TPA: hypothetical protein VGP76_04595 [Planctomycetaceae bacterium]|nr:hypothetical protein [Planctomycetaceae bacterium]
MGKVSRTPGELIQEANLRGGQRYAWGMIRVGIGVFVVCGGLFGLFCWWAAIAPNPPMWVVVLRPIMRISLMFLMAGTLAGPVLSYRGFKMLRAIAKKEEQLREAKKVAKKKARESRIGI